ncbi:MAG: hypothetical protein KZQ79_19070, partial [Candidatus Thiodiazotropha sp. (ex Lucinoma borealis)]|nr:hypothetical protein [Candidatus Thiodiazotropha sp. (ex Lucinoma borealis)]
MHRHIRFIGAMHAKHAQKVLSTAWIGAQPHQGLGNRKTQRIHKIGQRLGVSICYDLRFPELFRQLQDKGAEIFVVP